MKWRNQLLALFCLLVFFGFGVFYFQYWVIQKPFGIILFIAEGLDAETLAAARLRAGGPEQSLALDSFPHLALLKNYSADSAVPDPAAAATAIATGVRVRNGAVAVDSAGQPLTSLLDLARENGRVTGLITDGKITAPTAASFYGHAQSDEEELDFARQLAETAQIDVVLGGGAADFLPTGQGGRRTDERDLVSAMREADYDVVQTLAELEAVPRWRLAKLFGLFHEDELPFAGESKSSEDQPTLPDLVRRGIELLQFHRGGYLLVVDASLMRKARQQRPAEGRLEEVLEFDRAVSVALEYAGKKSTIFVCSDVTEGREPAFFAVSPSPSLPDKLQAIFASDPAAFTLESTNASNPRLPETPEPPDGAADSSPSPSPLEQPSPPGAAKPAGVPEDVLAFGTGLGAEDLRGTKDSTTLFELIRDNL